MGYVSLAYDWTSLHIVSISDHFIAYKHTVDYRGFISIRGYQFSSIQWQLRTVSSLRLHKLEANYSINTLCS